MANEKKKNSPPADMDEPADMDATDEAAAIPEEEPILKRKEKPLKATERVVKGEPKLVKTAPKEAPIVNNVFPRKAFILDKKGNKQPDPEEKGEFLKYEPGEFVRHVGYVNKNGVLFPVGFRFKGGHIADQPEEYAVVLNKCPKCGHRQSVDEAVQGECQNMKAPGGPDGELGPCGFSAFEELDSYDLEE